MSIFSIGLLLILIVCLFGNGSDVHFRHEGNILDFIPKIVRHETDSPLHCFDSWTTTLKYDYSVPRMDLRAMDLIVFFTNRNYSTDNYVEKIKVFLAAQRIKKGVLSGRSSAKLKPVIPFYKRYTTLILI